MSQRPFKILGIEHVGVAIESMEGISKIFSDIFGLNFIGSEEVKDQQVITNIFDIGSSKLEFLKQEKVMMENLEYVKQVQYFHYIIEIVENGIKYQEYLHLDHLLIGL